MKLIVILTLFLFTIFLPTNVWALEGVDTYVECPKEPVLCTVTGKNPLFTNSDVFTPGKTITRIINVKNISNDIRLMSLKASKKAGSNPLGDVLSVSIINGSTIIWSGSLNSFYNLNRVDLGNFSPNQDENIRFNVTMDSSVGNSYQNQQSNFDLTLGFWEEPASTGGGGGGGSSGGSGGSTCNDPAPAGAPTLLSANVTGLNQVTLSWSKAPNPVTYYLITYGLTSGAQQYGNPNVGDSNTTSYTISGLSGGTTYYFRVRAGNGCNGGPFSNELSATPGGPVLNNPPAGFLPGVLGSSQDNIGEGTSSSVLKDILGADKSDSFVEDGNWWQMIMEWLKNYWWLLLLFLLLLFLLWRRRHSEEETNS